MNNKAPTILIVDDEAVNRKLLEALLMPEGYRTISVASGEEALSSIAMRAPDLVLLDLMMPGMNGYEVASIIKSDPATSNIPIIIVTAQNDRGARVDGLKSGAEEFLTKPVDRTELWFRVRNLLRLKELSDLLQNQNTNLKQQVQARTADLQRFRSAMDATADSIMLINRSTMRFIEVNATACAMLGYNSEEMLQINVVELEYGTQEQLERVYDDIIVGHGSNELMETRVRRKDGSELMVEVHRRAQRYGADWIIVSVMRDITERKKIEGRLHHLAHYDALTGLPNRTLFYQTLEKTLVRATDSGLEVAVVIIDLDQFKTVNDTLGHAFGDELLRQFSVRLVGGANSGDAVGRLGGDEFALILTSEDGQQSANVAVNNIREALCTTFQLQGRAIDITASIGITVYPGDGLDAENLLKYAETAMYQAKQTGRNAYRFFTAQMNTEAMARLELEAALHTAVENNEFILHYQPKARLDDGMVCGAEALLRWQRPGHGLVAPNVFIPALEKTGLIVRVGKWVIEEACRQIALWMQTPVGPLQISVNVSGRQFVEGDLEGDIVSALGESKIRADLLELELTESSLMLNTQRTMTSLKNLKQCGVQISIDDFGTGYSSLAYLRRFPIDKLKIDIAFIRDITTNADDAAIARAIISMAHSLKLKVIAEGVETVEQLDYLRNQKCDQMQGYYFSRPLAAADLEKLLLQEKRLPVPDNNTTHKDTL
jgi:diguanylate cyclase (GGDEF)-like protein/PAS domain S-box-containing protein